jgi:hypothetical protein
MESPGVGDTDLFGYSVGEASAPSSVSGHGPPGEEWPQHQCKIQSSPHAPPMMNSVQTMDDSTHIAWPAQKCSPPLNHDHTRKITCVAFSLRICY